VQQVFNGTLERGYNRTLAFDLFTPTQPADASLGLASTKDITDRILDGQRASDASQSNRGMRLGYMGHLTLIAEEVCKFGNRQPPEILEPVILDRVNRDEWIEYVEGTLAETRDKDNAVLGGIRPQDSIGVRPMGLGGIQAGFSANTANTLASAGIGAGIAEMDGGSGLAGAGQTFEINSGTMLSSFGDGEEDEEMEEGLDGGEGKGERRLGPLDDDEQVGELSFEDVDMEYR
jgi:SIT4-associating protein SAP185/190